MAALIVRRQHAITIMIIPLLIDLIIGMLVRRLMRNAIWSALGFFLVPPSVAVITSGGPRYLFSDGGESHGWAVLAFNLFALLGFPTYLLGVVVGQMLRKQSIVG